MYTYVCIHIYRWWGFFLINPVLSTLPSSWTMIECGTYSVIFNDKSLVASLKLGLFENNRDFVYILDKHFLNLNEACEYRLYWCNGSVGAFCIHTSSLIINKPTCIVTIRLSNCIVLYLVNSQTNESWKWVKTAPVHVFFIQSSQLNSFNVVNDL